MKVDFNFIVRREMLAQCIALSNENVSYCTFPNKETKDSSYDSFKVSLLLGSA